MSAQEATAGNRNSRATNHNVKKRRVDHLHQVPRGSRGIIVTSNKPQRVRHALHEIIKVLRAINKTEDPDQKSELQSLDFESALTSELDSLAATERKSSKFFEICRGVGFVSLDESQVPSQLCVEICKHVRNDPSVKIYDVQRILPIDYAVSPPTFDAFCNSDAIFEYLRSLFPLAYKNANSGNAPVVENTWKVELNRRNNSIGSRTLWFDICHAASLGVDICSVKSAAIQDEKNPECPKLAELITPLKDTGKTPYKIVMKDAKHTIVLEVNPKLIGIGIATDYEALAKYNLSAL